MSVKIENSCGLKILEAIRINKVLPMVKGNLLDIGCGCNNLVKNYKKIYGGKGIGVDVYPWPEVDEVVKDSSKLKYLNDTFDTVSFLANLNHIPYRKGVLKEAYRLLKPGGLLIITMISSRVGDFWHKFPEKLWGERGKGRSFKEGEQGGLDHSEITKLVKEAGFVLKKRERFALLNNVYVAIK